LYRHKFFYLGKHLTELEAAAAYNQAALELYGPEACLNHLTHGCR
jgi:hypothetical protein